MPENLFVKNVAVVSQWLPAPQKQPMWLLEKPCWNGVGVEHAKIIDTQQGEYLVIRAGDDKLSAKTMSLYAWHFAALHRPPRVVADNQFIASLNVHQNWLIYQHSPSEDSEPPTVCVHDLNRNLSCSETLGISGYYCIMKATNSSMDFIQLQYGAIRLDSVVVAYKLWQVSLNHAAAPFKYRATGKREMFRLRGALARARRIDDSRFLLWAPLKNGEDEYDKPDPMETPSLVLLQISSGTLNVSLDEQWSSDVKAVGVWPIISRNMLCVDHKDATQTLLNLADGSVVHRVLLRCWYYSGLYPLESQWQSIPEDTEWDGPLTGVPGGAKVKESLNALVYGKGSRFTVIDYTGHSYRPKQKSPLAIEQLLARYIDVGKLTGGQRLMLTSMFS
ncbi:hypothetical protein THASP1DRAFT_32205 [Thamnocephalis sphaerospora]|uniref:Uncharacterized protein n=1 Tax=Thamnocephalis sphaerospora TaxID=78915 RepID=A0A4P9XL04_9FUNG|nr:hypothetical protein THASP1DRAFT_32205 [Thamnocephalis sphaerospora]|eukprot:RKP05970.1 hypothetical protein THASP1DRAFT_32205 [Thamnocephalis sphaerospora]